MTEHDRHDAGFKERTRVEAARERLLDRVAVHDRTERVPLLDADGRTVATAVTAERDVPHYRRAAMDGFAVRAEDTFGASDRSPAVLRGDEAERVHTGSAVPEWGDAVVMIEQTDTASGDVEVFSAVGEGENVAPVGEDVEAGDRLYEPGHRLRPSDLGLLKSVGLREVEVYERPDVAVIPTGEELVQDDPEPGEVVETNGLTVSRLAERWGASARYEDVVTDDEDALADAIEANVDADVVVTTGGSSVGERDLIPEVADNLGEVFVHGVALRPGHPVALGEVAGTLVVMLPGYPVACIVNAVQFLRPALKRVGGMPLDDPPSVQARLDGKIRSEPGVRTFARVRLREDGAETVAEPVSSSGSGVLSSVALADGWVVVPEQTEGVDAGETVAVENWEAHR
ncbi:gephyrin-like molybdotransferase Glp [Halobacterium sp. NMX12-1]|uniref:Gephyrin-like molybdotransferase Glp n=1 Tax=Halobacterium sp. NMX12-1 TaxID=3166650 RepID=A0AAU8CC56_9EURY